LLLDTGHSRSVITRSQPLQINISSPIALQSFSTKIGQGPTKIAIVCLAAYKQRAGNPENVG
jgi:hypothetical protein